MFKAMLRGLLAHRLRLVLSALAVVLGTMFMSAAFVAGDTLGRGFEDLFATVNADIDVEVTANAAGPARPQGDVATAFLDQATADRVAAVPGVATATARVISNGARAIGRDGKVVGTSGPPRFGTNWVQEPGDLVQLRSGRPPVAPDEIAVNAGLATGGGYAVGDPVDVLTLQPRRTFTLVGIFGYRGGRDSLGGETTVAFTTPVAQQLMLGTTGVFTGVDLTAAPGVSADELARRVGAVAGPALRVRTGAQVADEQSRDLRTFTTGLKSGLVVFALIGLFTGTFLIFNTFSMLVAQRTRELALYRSFGANRGQVNRAVLGESALLGLASSIVGLALGIGIGWLLVEALQRVTGANLPTGGVTVRPYVIISTLLVGTAITVVAASVPAVRASRVPPIAALREAVTPDRPLTWLTVAGAVVLAAGALLLALKVTDVVHGNLWQLLGGGGLLAFLGLALLAPALSRPFTAALGTVVGRGVPGRLGTRNTGRHPRRTAVTASALMIGVALVAGAGVFSTSTKAGVNRLFRQDLNAQLVVMSDLAAGPTAGFDPSLAGRMQAIPGVQTALAVRTDRVMLGGRTVAIQAGDVAAAATVFRLTATQGTVRPLAPGEILLDEATATAGHLAVGDTVPMRTSRGAERAERVIGVFARNQVAGGPFVSPADAAAFTTPLAQQGFVKVADPARVPAVKAQLTALFAGNPEVSVVDATALAAQQARLLDVILTILNLLLGLTILVAVLGVINTLLLSVFERTREFGLVRAVGMSRGQVGRMITVESVLISVYGTVLGLVAGVALGVTVVQALRSGGILQLAISWTYLLVILVLSVVAGVIAAILPAIRAARLNVLEAIAYE